MNASMAALKANACNTGTACKTNKACAKDFLVVVAHHDHCLSEQVPPHIEDSLHDFEEFCTSCFVARQFDPKLPVCDAVTCSDTAGLATAINFLKDTANNCSATQCAGACAAPFKRLRAAHDRCEEDDVPRDAEGLLHSLEDACAAVDCNVATAAFTLDCNESTTAAAAVTTTAAAGTTATSDAAALASALAVVVVALAAAFH